MLITDKGQVTIPKDLRDQLGLLPGTSVDFVRVGDHLEVRPAAGPGRGRRLVERMWGSAGPGMSTDEIMALTRADD